MRLNSAKDCGYMARLASEPRSHARTRQTQRRNTPQTRCTHRRALITGLTGQDGAIGRTPVRRWLLVYKDSSCRCSKLLACPKGSAPSEAVAV